jgi:hypothetical protein
MRLPILSDTKQCFLAHFPHSWIRRSWYFVTNEHWKWCRYPWINVCLIKSLLSKCFFSWIQYFLHTRTWDGFKLLLIINRFAFQFSDDLLKKVVHWEHSKRCFVEDERGPSGKKHNFFNKSIPPFSNFYEIKRNCKNLTVVVTITVVFKTKKSFLPLW